MLAPILTYDDRSAIAELTIKSYEELVPDNNLTFLVPYNDNKPEFKTIKTSKVEFVKTQKNVRHTVEKLLEGLHPESFIYWCFDDCYLHHIRNPSFFTSVRDYIMEHDSNLDLDCIKMLRFFEEKINKNKQILIHGTNYFNRFWFEYRFWFHQFIKVKTINNMFLDKNITYESTIREVDHFRVRNNKKYVVYVPEKDMYVLGETTRGNIITSNCKKAMLQYGIEPPKLKGFTEAAILNGANVNRKDLNNFTSMVKDKGHLKGLL